MPVKLNSIKNKIDIIDEGVNPQLNKIGWGHKELSYKNGKINFEESISKMNQKINFTYKNSSFFHPWEAFSSKWKRLTDKILNSLVLTLLFHLIVPVAIFHYIVKAINNHLNNHLKTLIVHLRKNGEISPLEQFELLKLSKKPNTFEKRLDLLLERLRYDKKITHKEFRKLSQLNQKHSFFQVMTRLAKADLNKSKSSLIDFLLSVQTH